MRWKNIKKIGRTRVELTINTKQMQKCCESYVRWDVSVTVKQTGLPIVLVESLKKKNLNSEKSENMFGFAVKNV